MSTIIVVLKVKNYIIIVNFFVIKHNISFNNNIYFVNILFYLFFMRVKNILTFLNIKKRSICSITQYI